MGKSHFNIAVKWNISRIITTVTQTGTLYGKSTIPKQEIMVLKTIQIFETFDRDL